MTHKPKPLGPEELLKRVAEAFQKSDLRPLFEAVTDETMWKSAATFEGNFRFGGEYKGLDGIKRVTSEISAAYVFRTLRPKEFVSKGEVVWGLFDAEIEFGESRDGTIARRPVQLELAIRWRVRNGKPIEHQAFFDTLSLLSQQA